MKPIFRINFSALRHFKPGLTGALCLLLVAGAGLNSCSNKKNTFTRRVYHNLTAHYNTWWNGNESLREGIRDLDKNVKDNYTEVLPVFKLGGKKDLGPINPKADRAIEKASKVIQNNSMYFNKKEYNRWIDDSYFMIGKAYFYKQEYTSARRTFEFILTRYKDSPLTGEIFLWLALTNNELGHFTRSEADLEKFRALMSRIPQPRSMMLFYQKVSADYWLKQERPENAKNHLHAAVQLSRDKAGKTRMLFILGQIYMEEGQFSRATEMFREVVRRNPRYDMVFTAQLNIAKSFDVASGQAGRIEKMLEGMLKDEKNKPYQDQIYYALAEIQFKQGNITPGMDYLRLSVARSKSNDFQRVQSSLRLAGLYFEKPQYIEAQAYYDTALQALPREHPDYEGLKEKTVVLTDLVTNLVVVQNEDSLQRLAAMPEAERIRVIDAIIAKIAEEERKKQEEERMEYGGLPGFNQMGRDMQTTTSGAWYFYNPSAISFGFTDFKRKWGNRKLEDLWRLSNKQVMDFGDDPKELAAKGDSLAGDSTLAKRSSDPKKRETYLQDIPLTPESILASNIKISEALFNAAFIYREGLKDLGNSAETFEVLATRFPDTAINKNYLITCYQLVVLNERLGNQEKADYYKSLLINGFPDTDYARILADPDYNREIERKNNAASDFYRRTYEAYTSGQYYLVVMNCDDARLRFAESKQIPKFDFLRALAIGKVDIQDSLVANLQKVVKRHPGTEVARSAADILQALARQDPELAGRISLDPMVADSAAKVEDVSIYNPGIQGQHFFLIAANSKQIDVNALKIRLSDFNERSYRLENFTISSIVLNDTLEVVSVGVFKSGDASLNYYREIIDNDYVFSALRRSNYDAFVISAINYPVYYQDKNTRRYMAFFEKEYLKRKN